MSSSKKQSAELHVTLAESIDCDRTFRRYSDMALLSRLLATPSRLGLRHAVTVPVRRGFRKYEHNLEWHRSLPQLFEQTTVSEDSVLVASPYEYEADERETPFLREGRGFVGQAMKYSMFHSHEELWEEIQNHRHRGQVQLFNEVLEEGRPRCLYFDLDGDAAYNLSHETIVKLLHLFVRVFFHGDALGWNIEEPEPVVLTSCRPDKYSCHVLFPQIQFANFAHQNQYLPALLRLAQEATVELEGQGSQHILKHVLDGAVYKKLQLLRGPWACKLKGGHIDTATRMEPEEPYWGDDLTCFASYVQPDYALELPCMNEIAERNPLVGRILQDSAHSSFLRREDNSIFSPDFQTQLGPKFLDLAGLTQLERYETCMELLQPERACDWWSWFRVSGVTSTMLDKYHDNDAARQRIWDTHCRWSGQYPHFCEQENFEVVMKAQERRTPGIKFLVEVLEHDYPGLEVRQEAWPFRIPHKTSRMAV
ncbi:unnamed protein product [Symbiodinium necroappetens]|uniref:Uncharacterized protein n=1 Tax=Symbiodinium necroappetens TaxID=1628268 RepID=A0A812MZF7_9DINO|nr:unnamed protein product [Symbiodinium necroappetens]